jgi:hypothetical protein
MATVQEAAQIEVDMIVSSMFHCYVALKYR